ncbi:MAG: immunoglobulin domain-containing protein [Limisphaerales bacterium]
MVTRIWIASLIGIFAFSQAQGQLAITEIMSSAKTVAAGQNPDYWELSNYGTNTVDLSGYRWNDNDGGLGSADSESFAGLSIAPGESIIFAQYQNGNAAINAEMFREWWGTGNVGTDVQIVFFNGNGLSSGGDSVILWGPNPASDSDYVDRVDFDSATLVVLFFTAPTPEDSPPSAQTGLTGAWTAVIGGDEGSPGVAPSPAPIVISQQPTNLIVTVGNTATFKVTGIGLPKPHFQWLLNGSPVDTNRVTITQLITNNLVISTLTIANAQGTNAGTYRAVTDNGVQTGVLSSNALLTVNGDPLAPVFTQTPVGVNAYLGQSPAFTAAAFGNPPPAYQWQFNGTDLDGQTSQQLQLFLSDTNQTSRGKFHRHQQRFIFRAGNSQAESRHHGSHVQ